MQGPCMRRSCFSNNLNYQGFENWQHKPGRIPTVPGSDGGYN